MNKLKKAGIILSLGTIFTMVACHSKEYSAEGFTPIKDIIAHAKTLTSSSSSAADIKKTGTPNFNVPEEGYDGSEVSIKFYSTQGKALKEITDGYIAKFNEIYPNIHVSHESIGSYDDVRNQIKTEIPVKNQPNIAYCYPDHVALYNLSKAVAHLDNFIDSTVSDGNGGALGLTDAQKNDFIAGYYNEGRQFGDGLMYSMPFSKSTEVLYYNKDAFTKYNLDVPTHWFAETDNIDDDKTSMEYVCKVLKQNDPTSIPLGYDSEANWMITMCEQCGSDYTTAVGDEHFLFDNNTNKGIAKRFREWYKNGWMTTQQLYGTYTSGLFVATKADETKSYMSIGSSAGASHQVPGKDDNGSYPFQVGITSIPQMCENNKKVISQGPSVCIFKKSNPQEVVASWLLVKYLTTSVQFQAEFGKASGYVPVLKSVAQDATYSAFIANADKGNDYATALAAKVCLEQESAYYTSPAFNGSSMARDQIGSALVKILGFNGTEDEEINKFINKAFADAVKECEESL